LLIDEEVEMIPARLGLVTLGVADLERSIAFYRALGWKECSSSIEGVIHWFRTADGNLGLFPYQGLADDVTIRSPTRGSFGGITLAINVERPEDVDAGLESAVDVGGTILKPATDAVFGRSGYFADPDGYPWEVAYNPAFPIGDDGRLTIP
jgi:catechol 2,3-dioxygenase-like lactoylglutathione lyase family enzyme